MDWGRLQGLIDELGGENGLSTLIETLSSTFGVAATVEASQAGCRSSTGLN